VTPPQLASCTKLPRSRIGSSYTLQLQHSAVLIIIKSALLCIFGFESAQTAHQVWEISCQSRPVADKVSDAAKACRNRKRQIARQADFAPQDNDLSACDLVTHMSQILWEMGKPCVLDTCLHLCKGSASKNVNLMHCTPAEHWVQAAQFHRPLQLFLCHSRAHATKATHPINHMRQPRQSPGANRHDKTYILARYTARHL
jgi:hypothetical protein